MKNMIVRASLFAFTLMLTACGGVSMERGPDGKYLGMTTVWHIDRSASRIAEYVEDGLNPNGSPKFKEVVKKVTVKRSDGSTVTEEVSTANLSVGPTVAGQATVAVVGGVSTAATQGAFGIAIAKEASKACKDGKCSGNGTVIYNDGSALSLSNSESNANSSVRTNGAPCTGPCLAH
ncbi:hypothetical protein IPH92_05025 [Candidatus Kaiserbacteria bacterium]|nr:MAG: hypothetical protein IPH92_05025 [Candidatus Kaiserbacteria bacterium]